MKALNFVKTFVLAALVGASALPTWAAANYSYGYDVYISPYAAKDTNPGDANVGWYKAYGMTQATARELLDKTTAVTYLDVAAWLANDFSGNRAAVIAKSQELTGGGSYRSNSNQYKFYDYYLPYFDGCDDFIGVIFFDNGTDHAYCVMGRVSGDGAESYFLFDDRDTT